MRYNADPTKDSAGFPVLPKADYRFKFGEPKPFENIDDNDPNKKNFGVAFIAKVVPGPVDLDGNESPRDQIGKSAYVRLFYHTDNAQSFRKQYILAAYGYTTNEENDFNEISQSEEIDWGFDPETGEVGEGFKMMSNKEFVASLSVQKRKFKRNGVEVEEEQNSWEAIRPIPIPGSESMTIDSGDIGEMPAELIQ